MPHRIALVVLASIATLTAGQAAAQAAGGSRAEEEASRPMRLILEAAKIKPKPKPAETPPAPAPRPATAPAPARPAAAAAALAVPGSAATEARIGVASEPPPSVPPSNLAPAQALAAPSSFVPETPPPRAAEPESRAEPAAALPPLKLRTLVEPVTPRQLAGRLRGEVRVEVQLNVAADGSVSEATVMASSHPQMNAAVLDAVRQWRYEPSARAREHAVQVVLRPDS